MTAPLPAARLAAIEAITSAAAEGPWLHDGWTVNGPEVDGCSALMVSIDVGDPDDAAFIAMARTALPELMTEVTRLRALLADGEPDVPGVSRVRILPTTTGAWRARYRLNGKRKSSASFETRELAVAYIGRLRLRHDPAAEAAPNTDTELTVQGDEAP